MKHLKKSAVVLAAVIALGTSSPVYAQDSDIGASCAASGSTCVSLMVAKISALKASGLVGPALDAAIGSLVASVYSASATVTPATRAAMASAIQTAARSVSSPTSRAGMVQAASAVRSGTSTRPLTAVASFPTTPTTTPGTTTGTGAVGASG